MPEPARQKRFARFGSFVLDLRTGELRKKGHQIRLQNQPFQILVLLLENPGEVVTQEQIQEKLWPVDTVVEFEHSIGTALKKLRQALGDDAAHPRYIETLSRRGYRWLVPVEWEEMAAAPDSGMARTGLEFRKRAVESVRAVSVVDEVPRVALVGRARELETLNACLETMLGGQRQIVFVTGEPGIGKTALIDEFARQAEQRVPELRIARGQCVEGYGGKEAYYPVLEAVGELSREAGNDFVQILASQAPTWLVQFPALLSREHRETLQREILGATRERMLREIGDALETLSATTPLLLILEDLHWADHSTVDLLSVLGRRRGSARMMLIGTKRPLELDLSKHPLEAVKQDLLVHRLCTDVVVSPLSEAEVARYLGADSSEGNLPKGLATLLHRHTGGNPLFLVAAVEHLTERSMISQEKGGWKLQVPLEKVDLGVPQRMRRMIESQIERLSNEEQRALEVASVSGVAFEAGVTAAAAEMDSERFEDLCEKLSRERHVLRWAGSGRLADGTVSLHYEFVHALYREAFYQRQAMGRRVKLHQRIGEQLEAMYAGQLGEVGAMRLASHFEEAGDWPRAVNYLLSAASTAVRRFEPREAAKILEHALELVNKIPDAERARPEIEILQKLASIYSSTFDPRSLEIYPTLVSRAAHYSLLDVQFSALLEMAIPMAAFRGMDAYTQTVQRARDLLEHSREKDSVKHEVMRARCHRYLACGGKWVPGELENCRELIRRVRESGDRQLLGEFEFALAYSFLNSSRYREARQYADESFEVLLQGSEENLYSNIHFKLHENVVMMALVYIGEWGEALRESAYRAQMAQKNNDSLGALMSKLIGLRGQIFMLDFAGARHAYESILPAVIHISSAVRESHIYAGLAEVGLGNPEGALTRFRIALDDMAQLKMMQDWYNRMPLHWGVAEAWLLKGDLEKARVEAAEFLKVTLATDEHTYWALAFETNARVAMAEQDFGRAQEFLGKALESMEGLEVPLAHWRVHATAFELYKLLGNPESAEGHREQSRTTIMKLADSLPPEERLRQIFLSAPLIRKILDEGTLALTEEA